MQKNCKCWNRFEKVFEDFTNKWVAKIVPDLRAVLQKNFCPCLVNFNEIKSKRILIFQIAPIDHLVVIVQMFLLRSDELSNVSFCSFLTNVNRISEQLFDKMLEEIIPRVDVASILYFNICIIYFYL
jgi:hypothetical protein